MFSSKSRKASLNSVSIVVRKYPEKQGVEKTQLSKDTVARKTSTGKIMKPFPANRVLWQGEFPKKAELS